MKKYSYSFVTSWKFESAIEPLWDIIYDFERWPEWWKAVKKVEILDNGVAAIGKKVRYSWKSDLPYTLRFCLTSTHIDKYHLIEGVANGDLDGFGLWKFTEKGGITTITCSWDVNTNKKWMNIMAPILKPIFRWNHAIVMRWGAKGLAKKLNIPLLK